ncbi:MAG: YraN family protein [candidate division WOR-3 bacterium]|nr:YraN family protein [candidate division WOR-3 bacterium]MDH5683362.1 YraN family protein [candidate division WOR-3 bacterium]
MSDKISLGKQGEKIALSYLKSKRFKIIEKNLRNRFGELDIIAQDKKTLVFIEVKTRTSEAFGNPIQGIDKRKQYRLRMLAQKYIAEKGLLEQEVRFDVLGILQTGKQTKIEHIPNAF